jgi:Ca2+-binding EF-hand superfamily protein
MAVKQVLQARMEKHIKEMVTTNPMIGQLNTQFTSWLLGSGLTGTEIIQMIDSNMDAVIQPTELSDALQRTTGTQPPGWVINGLMSVLDMDKDGNVTVADLHTYFETIGLPSGIEEPEPEPEPDEFEELDQEIEEEARRQAEELIRQQEAEKQRLLEEQQAKEAAEREAEEKARREEEAAKAKPEPILLEEDGSPVGHARFIELLQDMKLSSERREAISQSPNQSCKILVSSVEKTLMGQGPMKNGMTVIGTLSENRDIEVELQLPSEANERAQAFKSNHSIEAVAQIVNWNVGRKRAIFTATDFDYS